jgi:hypothetical protein
MCDDSENPYQSPRASLHNADDDARLHPAHLSTLKSLLWGVSGAVVLAAVLIFALETLRKEIVIVGLVLIAIAAIAYYAVEKWHRK